MKTKGEIAAGELRKSFNCAQTVLLSFADDYDLDQETAAKLAVGLGGGCHCGEICGALSAGCIVVGLKHGGGPSDPAAYANARAKVAELIAKFKQANGAVSCRDLLGLDTSRPGYRDFAVEQGLFDTVCAHAIKSTVDTLEELGY